MNQPEPWDDPEECLNKAQAHSPESQRPARMMPCMRLVHGRDGVLQENMRHRPSTTRGFSISLIGHL